MAIARHQFDSDESYIKALEMQYDGLHKDWNQEINDHNSTKTVLEANKLMLRDMVDVTKMLKAQLDEFKPRRAIAVGRGGRTWPGLIVICNDGSIWAHETESIDDWKRLKDIPQT